MAIIKCPECQNEVSDKAATCPKCGCPINKHIHFSEQQYRDEQAVYNGIKKVKAEDRNKTLVILGIGMACLAICIIIRLSGLL